MGSYAMLTFVYDITSKFFFIFVFSIQLTLNNCSVYKFADDWIRTADLWCRRRPLYQLSHNHCPREKMSLEQASGASCTTIYSSVRAHTKTFCSICPRCVLNSSSFPSFRCCCCCFCSYYSWWPPTPTTTATTATTTMALSHATCSSGS